MYDGSAPAPTTAVHRGGTLLVLGHHLRHDTGYIWIWFVRSICDLQSQDEGGGDGKGEQGGRGRVGMRSYLIPHVIRREC